MATTTDLHVVAITLNFADDTTRTVTFRGVDPDELPNVKARIRAINANMSTAFKETFISKDGAYCTKIGKATITATREEVIYSATN